MDAVPFSAFFAYIHPTDADALSLTCKAYYRWVCNEYRRVGREAVLPGGCWHSYLCKRAQWTIGTVRPNYMPKALASLVDSQCIVCRKRLLASVSFWGFAAHKPCARGMLLNTYYVLEKLGLSTEDLRCIPSERLVGYQVVSRNQYEYDAVFRQPWRRYVPSTWTLQHVVTRVLGAKVRGFRDRKRKAAAAARAREDAKRQRQLDLENKRQEAVALRRAKLEAHPQAGMVRLVVHVLGSKCVLGDYLKPVIHAPTSLTKVVDAARGYAATLDVLVRDEVTKCIEAMVRKIIPRSTAWTTTSPAVRISPAPWTVTESLCVLCQKLIRARDCSYERCGRCCTGCLRHQAGKRRSQAMSWA